MQTFKLAMAMKLVSLGHVSLDGSKFKANSSRHKAMTYKSLKEKEQTGRSPRSVTKDYAAA